MELRPPPSPAAPSPPQVTLHRHGDFVAFYEIFIERCYAQLLERVEPGDVVVDAGANIGLFSLLASPRVGPKGLVLAVESNPENFKRLIQHIRQNHLENVRPLAYAVTGFSDQNEGMVGDGIRARVVDREAAEYTVRSITIDDLAERQQARPTVLKMDIEGSEGVAFAGMKATLPHLRAAAIEVHDRLSAEVIRAGLDGFRTSRLERPGFGAYLRFGLRHPYLLPKLELNNRLRSVRRVLHDGGEFSRNPDGLPFTWFAERLS